MNIDKAVQKFSLLKHPFYQMWLDGSLPQDAMKEYAKQYFHLVDALPRAVARQYSMNSDPSIRAQLLLNLREEEGFGNGGIAHTDLWLQFAEALGVSEEEVIGVELLPKTKKAVNILIEICSGDISSAAAGLYAYESQVPQISEEKIVALKEQYGISNEKALAFFEVHKVADIKHTAVWKQMVEKDSESEIVSVQASEKVAKALWEMFDGMQEAYIGKDCVC